MKKHPRYGAGRNVHHSAGWQKHRNKFESKEFWGKFRRKEKELVESEVHQVLSWWDYPDGDDPNEDFDQLQYECIWEDFNYDLIERIGNLIEYKGL